MLLDDSNLSPSSRATLPTLTEITFRLHSAHCYSFTATIWDGCDGRGVSLAQLARLIASTGPVGKIDDFNIKPIKQHSYLLSGFSRHTSSSITAEAGRDHVDATRTRPQDGNTAALLPRDWLQPVYTIPALVKWNDPVDSNALTELLSVVWTDKSRVYWAPLVGSYRFL